MDVSIIDYNMGNMHSVQAACSKVGLSSRITADKDIIMESKSAILPGVGAFSEAMSHIRESGLDECIYNYIKSGRPFMGVCLGLQLLFEESDEFGQSSGLGIIKGSVCKIDMSNVLTNKYPVPHVGWNRINDVNEKWEQSFLEENRNGDFMYFVHSHYVKPKDKNIILSSTKYGNKDFCSAILYNNIFATQFHPEKSGSTGLKIYEKLKNKLKS